MLSVTVFALLAAQPAQPTPAPKADAPGFGFPADKKTYWPLHTLASESVQKELKFTAEQATAAATLTGEHARQVAADDKLTGAAAAKAHADLAKKTDLAIHDLLAAGQRRRFREVAWQVMEHAVGPIGMTNNPVFAKELGLTAAQVRAVAKAAKDRDTALLAARKDKSTGAAPPDLAEIQATYDGQVMKALTEGQKRKWDELTGEPFLHKIDMPRGVAPFSPPIPKK